MYTEHRTDSVFGNNRPKGGNRKKAEAPKKTRNKIYRNLEDFLHVHSIGVKNAYGDRVISGIRIA